MWSVIVGGLLNIFVLGFINQYVYMISIALLTGKIKRYFSLQHIDGVSFCLAIRSIKYWIRYKQNKSIGSS
jgi:hypothetical protein